MSFFKKSSRYTYQGLKQTRRKACYPSGKGYNKYTANGNDIIKQKTRKDTAMNSIKKNHPDQSKL